jgi:hypothetical protein
LAKYEADTTHGDNRLCEVTSEVYRNQRYDLHAPSGDKAQDVGHILILMNYVGADD